jgi:rhodanese-related sulfurtransferase/biotin operon repressor
VQGREFKDGIFDQFARIGAAFSSPKRVEIIDILAQGERTVESMAGATSMAVANTSRHLQMLRRSGIVVSRRQGLYSVYRLADESVIIAYRAIQALAEERISEVRYLAGAFFGHVDGVEPLTLDELIARSGSDDVVLVDVRPSVEFAAGHLPGAISIPLDEVASRILEFEVGTPIVAYCRGPYCVMAAEAVAQLRAAGLEARRLEGGPIEWRARGRHLEANYDLMPSNTTG